MNDIAERLKRKDDIEIIANQIIEKPELVDELVLLLEKEKSALKFSIDKLLRIISEKKPEIVYPYFHVFVRSLDSENKFLKWGAILTIANLTVVDSENKFDKIFKKYFRLIDGPDMVAAANAIGNAGKIVSAKPYLLQKISARVLEVQKAKYYHKKKLSKECRNVVIGQAIDYFREVLKTDEPDENTLSFIKKQKRNSRPQVAKKARLFIDSHSKKRK